VGVSSSPPQAAMPMATNAITNAIVKNFFIILFSFVKKQGNDMRTDDLLSISQLSPFVC
jgi:hypothetical protein